MGVRPVIMCGGSGVRLWPASRPSRPKQFIPLIGSRSIFQATVVRVAGIPGAERPLVVAGVGHAAAIRRQLAEVGIEADLVLEPQARDSAPAMAAAAAFVAARDPEGVMVVVASDHHIPDDAAFQSACATAAQAALADGVIVTLGVRPLSPSTAYGYIRPGAAEGEVKPVAAFVEKPNADIAAGYVADGYLWNSGNFIVRADRLLAELAAFAPEVTAAAEAGVAGIGPDGRLADGFTAAPKISIDYAVMEKTAHAAVLPVSFEWSDLGAWDAILPASPRDADGNAALGDVRLHGSRNILARNDGGPLIVAVGVSDLAIIAEKDAILVCALSAAQGVKAAVESLKAEGAPAADVTAETLPQIAARLQRWLDFSALPLWAAIGLDHAGGGFHEAITQEGAPDLVARRARVQPRQAYVFARAGKLGWHGPWKNAVQSGLTYLNNIYHRQDGLYRTLTGPSGEIVDDRVVVYDQAFAMLAWSELGEQGKALSLLDRLESRRHPAGGFFEEVGERYQSNPHMHLFEAALGWVEAGGDSRWRDLAAEIADLALSRFIDPQTGAIREFFDADWNAGTRLEPGHQFEWAWLLARWSKISGDQAAYAAALRLFDNGLAGVDLVRDVAVDAVGETRARLWPQTEWLKAALILGRPDEAVRAARAFARYLDTPITGLWRDKMLADGSFVDEVAPASSLYHIAVAIAELTAYVQAR